MGHIICRIEQAKRAHSVEHSVAQGVEHLTYEDMWEEALRVAALVSKSHSPWVAVNVRKNVRLIPALLGCWLARKGYLPIHPDYPEERVRFILEDSGAEYMLFPEGQEFALTTSLQERTSYTEMQPIEYQESNALSDPAYLLFTSGSTGKPKGVPIYHEQLAAFVEAFFNHCPMELTSRDRFLQMFEYTFDLSVFSTFVPLSIGACTYLLPNEGITAFNVVEVLEEKNITVALMVPSVLAYLKPYFKEIALPSLRYNLFCGEALKWSFLKDWRLCLPNALIENVYGPTEATIFCSAYPITDETPKHLHHDIVPIGKPLPNVHLSLQDQELIISGKQVTSGYWKNPEKSQAAFFVHQGENHYRTGDLCYTNETMDYVFMERKDFQVKIDGHRVELAEIEQVAFEYVQAECIATAVLTEQNTFSLHLFITREVDTKQLEEHLSKHLPPYMLPKHIHYLPQLPLNPSGKVDRKQLQNLIANYV